MDDKTKGLALPSDRACAPDGAEPAAQSQAKPLVPSAITLHLLPRSDGGLRIHCDEIPGFVLSHGNPDKVMLDVLPVLQEMGWRP